MATSNDLVKQEGSQLAVRTRKSKGKSRGGCVACKQRKVKCDEARPTCLRCKTSSRSCIYEMKSLPKWKDKVGVLVLSPTSKPARIPKIEVMEFNSHRLQDEFSVIDSIVWSDYESPGYQLSTMPTDDRYTIRSEDSSILAHFMSRTSCALVGTQEIWMQQGLTLAFQNDFLMHAILALSARHIQHLQGYDAKDTTSNLNAIEIHHHHQTLSTYQRAFRDNTIRINQDAVIATSLLLCFYSCSVLDFRPSANATDSCLTFYPGIRSIVSDAPEIAHNGLFRSIVTPPLFLRNLHPSIGPGARLLNLLNTLPASATLLANKELYIELIESLTLYMSTSTMQNLEGGALAELLLCFLRWQSFCPMEFVALVRAFDPVSLIILAHYYAAGGFAHSRAGGAGWWWWKEKPTYMVRTIAGYLAPQWNTWLDWPKSMIERSGEGRIFNLTDTDVSKPWSAAVDPLDASFFPELYNWERLKRFSRC